MEVRTGIMWAYRISYSHSRGQIICTIKNWTGNTPGNLNQLDTHPFILSQVVQDLEDLNDPSSLASIGKQASKTVVPIPYKVFNC